MKSAGRTQNRSKAKSAETQKYKSCELNEMYVHMDENKEELSFVPSAVSSSGVSRNSCVTGSAGKNGSTASTSHQ